MKNIGENNHDLPYLYWLMQTPGIGNRTAEVLLKHLKSAQQIYQSGPEKWRQYASQRQSDALELCRKRWQVIDEYEKLQEKGIRLTGFYLDTYPKRLLSIPDAPAVLFYKGALPSDEQASVAIIGARMCSAYGKVVAEQFAASLAENKVQVISGLAMGIDGIGQASACRNQGKSFAVLGCGVDICYPRCNQSLYDSILNGGGGILSEYLPGTQPRASLFPPRNRIISGLSDIILVVEAKEKSGTLITVDMALEQGKEVYAVPGRITDALQEGCHKLIKQGAAMATCPQDILWALEQRSGFAGMQKQMTQGQVEQGQGTQKGPAPEKTDMPVLQERMPAGMSVQEAVVWKHLDLTPKTIEQIWEELHQEQKEAELFDGISGMMYQLILLCSRGAVVQQSGTYSRTGHII